MNLEALHAKGELAQQQHNRGQANEGGRDGPDRSFMVDLDERLKTLEVLEDGLKRRCRLVVCLSAIYGCGYNSCGCNLKLSEVRSGSRGVDSGPGLGPFGPEPGPRSTPNDPDRTSDNLKLQPHEL